jgi:CRISPR-associated protein Cmr1
MMSDMQDLLAQAKKSLENPQPRDGRITLEREYELLTPLFGGGPAPGETDPITPIRGTEIRGHLRFWWRATRGGRFKTIAALRAEEERIWGSASQASKVVLAITRQSPGKPLSTVKVKKKGKVVTVGVAHPDSPYSYGAFPLRDKGGALLTDVNFTLRITCPDDFEEDVRAALWAWETFGGIGARTRRGFGAVHYVAEWTNGRRTPVKLPFCDAENIKKEIRKKLKQAANSQWKWPKGVPHLASNMVLEVINVNGGAEDAWLYLIKQLRKFRQSREGNDYGPSHWPEGNAVRRADGRPPSKKSPDMGNIAPRAPLGLPVIFHFPQEDTQDGTLKGKKTERLASRLILRPLRCTNGQAVALAAVLKSPIVPPDGLVLEVGGNETAVTHQLSAKEAAQIVPLNGETSLIKAFFKQLRGEK